MVRQVRVFSNLRHGLLKNGVRSGSDFFFWCVDLAQVIFTPKTGGPLFGDFWPFWAKTHNLVTLLESATPLKE